MIVTYYNLITLMETNIFISHEYIIYRYLIYICDISKKYIINLVYLYFGKSDVDSESIHKPSQYLIVVVPYFRYSDI